MNDNYDDIINLPHYVSKKYPQMSMMARAAQFAPFAALSTHNGINDNEKKNSDENSDTQENQLD